LTARAHPAISIALVAGLCGPVRRFWRPDGHQTLKSMTEQEAGPGKS